MAALSIGIELLRFCFGLFVLPWFLVRIPSDDYVASFATGGEWIRLNATSAINGVCFGKAVSSDSRCRYLEPKHCEAHFECIWAKPSKQVLAERAKCLEQPDNAPFGGQRCSAILANEPGAHEAIRVELRVILVQCFFFLLANTWLMRWHDGNGLYGPAHQRRVIGLFVTTAALGSVRLSFL